MLHFLYADQLDRHPVLKRGMFRDRADQFATRLGWEVTVENGEERDAYDALNPLYVIWQDESGGHGGSLRLLPTTGPCMVNDHFTHLTDGVAIRSPLIWECTRFCLSRGAKSHVAAALMLGGGEVMRRCGVEHLVGVFDARMVRIYRAIGASPTVVGARGEGAERISVGLWEETPEARARVARRAGIDPAHCADWYAQSQRSPRAPELKRARPDAARRHEAA